MDTEPLLPASVLKSIGDKMYERRKLAALEVEQIMKRLAAGGENDRIRSMLGRLVDDFALSGQANHRKGGLLCLAAATVGLKQYYDKLKFDYLGQIVRPVAASLSDQDSRVRYYACEALYNIAKSTQEDFIANQHLFMEVYSSLFKLYGDLDEHVQNAAQHLDEVLKNLVTSSSNFDVDGFIGLLKEFLNAPNPHKRQFLIGWVTALFSVPSVDVLPFLPDILGGIMSMLSDEHKEIRQSASKALQDFLVELSSCDEDASIDFHTMIDVLLDKAASSDKTTTLTAMNWLNVVVEVAADEIVEQYGAMVGAVLANVSHSNTEVQKTAQSVNRSLLKVGNSEAWERVDVTSLLDAVSKEVSSSQEATRLEALQWLEFLLEHRAPAVLDESYPIVAAILDGMMTNWEKVVVTSSRLLAKLARQEGHFRTVMEAVLNRFRGAEGMKLLHRSGVFIIQQLCSLLGSRQVYTELASILESGPCGDTFASMLVQALNVLLLTAPEVQELQVLLRRGLGDEDAQSFFLSLYPSWCRSACAVLCLCFLSQSYDLAWRLISNLGDMPCGLSLEAVVQIVRLVKLLETPAFTFLRLQLLEPNRYPTLVRCLHGLLMLLPQTEAFKMLFTRLRCAPDTPLGIRHSLESDSQAEGSHRNNMDYSAMVAAFERWQRYEGPRYCDDPQDHGDDLGESSMQGMDALHSDVHVDVNEGEADDVDLDEDGFRGFVDKSPRDMDGTGVTALEGQIT